jgi:NAD(P)-dependent dehydrogenase (short-subunit alcohol dehydrogenase family)
MSVPLAAVRASNSSLSKQKGLIALFVGGTSGIGESTLRAFAKETSGSKIYLIGRSEEAAAKIKETEAEADIDFIKADLTLLSEVDRVCDIVQQKETKVNLLFMSPGILTTQGRTGK